jgi:ketosteroid isomerase-like protein
VRKTQADLVVGAVAARELPATLRAAARPGVTEVVTLLRANRVDEARARWAEVVPATGLRSPVDVNALVQWVLRESYLESTQLAGTDGPTTWANRVTHVFRVEDGAWRLVHRHANRLEGRYEPGSRAC